MKETPEQRWQRTKQPQLMRRFHKKDPRTYLVLKENTFEPLKEVNSSYLTGKIGSGKTVQAAWMFLEWNRLRAINKLHDHTCAFTPVPDMLDEIRKGIKTNEDQIILEQYQQVNLLVLDDLGAGKMSDWVYERMYLLITHRYKHMKTTIYTSNQSIESLIDYFGDERLPSRIKHDCKGNIFEYKRKSMR